MAASWQESSRVDRGSPVVIVGRYSESTLELRSAEDLLLLKKSEKQHVVVPGDHGAGGLRELKPIRVAKLTEDEQAAFFAVTMTWKSGTRQTAVAVFDAHSLVKRIQIRAQPSLQIKGLECIPSQQGFGPGSPMIVSGDSNWGVFVWNATSGKRIARLGDKDHKTGNQHIWGIRFVREWNSELFTCGYRPCLFRYNLEKNMVIANIQSPGSPGFTMLGLEADKSRGVLYSFWEGNKVLIFARDCSRFVKSLACPSSAYCGYFAEDLNLIFAGLNTGKVCVFDPRKEDRMICEFTVSSGSSATIHDIDRIGERRFVSVSRDLVSWTSEGKVVAMSSLGRGSYGVCSIGTPFDRIQKISTDPERDERFHFVEEMNSRWNFCHELRMGRKCVMLPRWC